MNDLISEVPTLLLASHRLDRLTPLLGQQEKPEGYDPALVALASINNLIWLIRASTHGAETAYSWRNYNVGAAVLAYNLEKPSMGINVGANFKPVQDGGPNFHAEQVALAKTRKAGLDHVFGIAVWGDPTDLDANPIQAPTLRPCVRCSNMLEELPEVKPETLIISGNNDLSVCELYTAEELSRYYRNPNAEGPVSEVPLYSLADDMDDDQYNQEVYIPYLIPKVLNLYQNAI